MGRSFLCVIVIGLFAPLAHAQFTSLRRTLDVRAVAPAAGFPTVIDDPPPVVRDPDFFGSISTSANAANPNGFQVSANIQATSTWGSGQLRWTASGFSSSTSPLGDFAAASGTGQAVISVTAPTEFEGIFPPLSGLFGIGAELRDDSGVLLWQRSAERFQEVRFPFTLEPGQYTVNTSFGTLHEAGHGGSGNTSFTMTVIPEPAGAALALAGLAACHRAAARRR